MRKADPLKLDQVRDEILRAAMELFTKYGIDKTTMENIAEAAGKGKSTLYYYFKTKEDVFSAAATWASCPWPYPQSKAQSSGSRCRLPSSAAWPFPPSLHCC